MTKYICYCRKSTDEKDRQVLSIDGQLSELKEFALREKLQVIDFITESKTAKEPGREKFAEVLKRIEKGEANGILSWHPDRLARNSIDGGRVIYLLDTGKLSDLKFPTFWFDNTPQGKFMLNIAFGQSKYYVDSLSENVKRGIREKLRRGIWPKEAPLGYFNDLKTKLIEVDPKKSKVVKKAFEKFSEGNISFSEIARFMSINDIKTKKGESLKVDQVKHMLRNPFYIGTFLYSGELYKGTHKTFISKALFNSVQKQIQMFSRPRNKGHNFPFRGFIKCAECGSAITAETHPRFYKRTNRKVVFNYYRCTKSLGSCGQKYITDVELEKQIRSIVLKSSLPKDVSEIWEKMFEEDRIKEEKSASQRNVELESKISNLEDQENTLLDGYLQHIVEPEIYKKKKNEIFDKKLELNDEKKKIGKGGAGCLEPFANFIKTAKDGEEVVRAKNNLSELAVWTKNAGSNFFLGDKLLKPILKKGFDTLFSARRLPNSAARATHFTFWAGSEGIEPSLAVLETAVLPLNDDPISLG
jgi:site-specific DNA recombinase